MPLDPQASAYLDQMAAVMPPLDTLTPDVIRAAIQAQVAQAAEQGAPEPVAQVNDRAIPGPAGEIPVRVYTPEGDGPFPLLVYVHGGGWVICTLDTHDGLCRSLANQARCVVVSVDYRLAPERPFPAAPEDCYAATRWVAAHATTLNGDAMRVAVGGDSAGGNLAAVVALLARERGGAAARLPTADLPRDRSADGQLVHRGKRGGLRVDQARHALVQGPLSQEHGGRDGPAGVAPPGTRPEGRAAGVNHHRRVRPPAG